MSLINLNFIMTYNIFNLTYCIVFCLPAFFFIFNFPLPWFQFDYYSLSVRKSFNTPKLLVASNQSISHSFYLIIVGWHILSLRNPTWFMLHLNTCFHEGDREKGICQTPIWLLKLPSTSDTGHFHLHFFNQKQLFGHL